MYISYEFENCIICQKSPPGDPEHIIPESLGGRLSARILCNKCNHTFGSTLVSRIKSDPSIRFAIEALKDEIPGLYGNFQKKNEFIGESIDGSRVRVSRSGNELRVLPSKGGEGSIILDTGEAVKALEKKLERADASAEEIENWKTRFSNLDEDIQLRIPTGETFVKRPLPSLRRQIHGESIDDRLVALVAYEYLSILIGNHIHRSSFQSTRDFILTSKNSDLLSIEHYFAGSEYGPFHALLLVPTDAGIRIDLRFFRSITFVVTFGGFDYEGLDPVYYEDLHNHQSCFSPSTAHFREGKAFCSA